MLVPREILDCTCNVAFGIRELDEQADGGDFYELDQDGSSVFNDACFGLRDVCNGNGTLKPVSPFSQGLSPFLQCT